MDPAAPHAQSEIRNKSEQANPKVQNGSAPISFEDGWIRIVNLFRSRDLGSAKSRLGTQTQRQCGSGGQFALHPSRSVLRQLGRVFQVKLMLNLLAVIFNRLDAQMQFVGNFAGLLPLANQLEDL